MVRGETDNTASDIQVRSFMARTLDEIDKKCSAEGKTEMGNWKNKMLEDYEETISLTLRTRISKKPLGMLEEILNTDGPSMPCKTCKKNKNGETRSKTNDFKSKFACVLEASESTRVRMEEPLPNYHEDHIAGRGDNSLQQCNLVHKYIPMPQAMKTPAAKAAVDKEWGET